MPTCGGIGTYLPNYHTMQVSGQGKNTTLHCHQWTHHCDQIIVDISNALLKLITQFEYNLIKLNVKVAPEMSTIFRLQLLHFHMNF